MSLPTCSSTFVLGVDLGTTSVKAVLLDCTTRSITDSNSLSTAADRESQAVNVGI